MHEYDTSSKYMIQRHGDSILRMAGVRDIASWKPLQAELIKHRRLPDGLIEVRHHGEKDRDNYLIEIATYPEHRASRIRLPTTSPCSASPTTRCQR